MTYEDGFDEEIDDSPYKDFITGPVDLNNLPIPVKVFNRGEYDQ
jgi:hypothetical protein